MSSDKDQEISYLKGKVERLTKLNAHLSRQREDLAKENERLRDILESMGDF